MTYLEGYLWDKPRAKDAFRVAMAAAHRAGRRVSLTLSDSFCVERHRDEFRSLVENDVDVLFANEEEILALTADRDLSMPSPPSAGRSEIVVITRSEHGSMVVTAEDTVEVPAATVERLVDTTGAGDLYAAGFLHGLTTGGRWPSARARVARRGRGHLHLGARPRRPGRPGRGGRVPVGTADRLVGSPGADRGLHHRADRPHAAGAAREDHRRRRRPGPGQAGVVQPGGGP